MSWDAIAKRPRYVQHRRYGKEPEGKGVWGNSLLWSEHGDGREGRPRGREDVCLPTVHHVRNVVKNKSQRQTRHTVFQSYSADDVPADTTDVDPSDLHPGVSSTCFRVFQELDELSVRHTTETSSRRRVVYDINQTFLKQ